MKKFDKLCASPVFLGVLAFGATCLLLTYIWFGAYRPAFNPILIKGNLPLLLFFVMVSICVGFLSFLYVRGPRTKQAEFSETATLISDMNVDDAEEQWKRARKRLIQSLHEADRANRIFRETQRKQTTSS